MNVVDSSAWIDYFASGRNAEVFGRAIEDVSALIVPSITMTEVFKTVARREGESNAIQAMVAMRRGLIVSLDAELAVYAARLGMELRLPIADSIVLATARVHEAVLWTQDSDFEGMPGVEYRKAQPIPR